MKSIQFTGIVVGLMLSLALVATAQETRVGPQATPLLSITAADGWYAGTRLEMAAYEFEAGPETLQIDVDRAVAQLGYRVLPWAVGVIEAGACKAEMDDEDGETGVELAGSLSINVLEQVIKTSPVVGRKQVAGLLLDLSYRYCESNFGERDLNWSTLTAMPSVYYLVNRTGEAIWRPFEPTGITLRGGLIYRNIEGDYGTESLDENRDFGFLVATDIYGDSGWVTQLTGRFYGSDDHEVGLTVGHNF
jgi:hypothetical protein